MSNDVADWTSSVVIQSGSVTISGTATVQITGTPTVQVTGTPTVNVGNTPAVTISSGTVTATISGSPNVNILSQSVTVNVNQPQTKLADLAFPNGVSTQTTAAVPAGTHSLGMWVDRTSPALTITQVKGHASGNIYYPPATANAPQISPGNGVEIPIDSTQDTTYDVTATAGGATTVHVTAYLDTSVVYVANQPITPLYVAPAPYQLQNQGGLFSLPQAYDVTGFSAPASGSQATVTLAATAGKFYRATYLAAAVQAGAATAFAVDFELLDGVTILMQDQLGVPATVGSLARYNQSGLAYKGSVNTSMTLKFGNANANDTQRVDIAAYLF